MKCFTPKTECLVINAFNGDLLVAIENDYLKSADKGELLGLINAKVSQSDYDTQIAALVAADESVLAQAKKYTDDSLEWIDVTGEN